MQFAGFTILSELVRSRAARLSFHLYMTSHTAMLLLETSSITDDGAVYAYPVNRVLGYRAAPSGRLSKRPFPRAHHPQLSKRPLFSRSLSIGLPGQFRQCEHHIKSTAVSFETIYNRIKFVALGSVRGQASSASCPYSYRQSVSHRSG